MIGGKIGREAGGCARGYEVVEVECVCTVLVFLDWRVQASCVTTNIGIRHASTGSRPRLANTWKCRGY